jgi:hypothetical protein
MDLIRWLVNLILIALILLLGIFGFKFMCMYYPEKMQAFSIVNPSPNLPSVENISNEFSLFYPNLRFNHKDITFFINEECSSQQKDKLIEAFLIITNYTEIIKFYPSSEENADILIGCSKNSYEAEESVFIAGEGGPTKIINSTYFPIIEKGKILLYNQKTCEKPITELHELIHVLGFEHVNNTKSIMYPYLSCEQEVDSEIINMLKELYSIEPKAELYFLNASAVKFGKYVNFSVNVRNEGLISAQNIILKVISENIQLDSFDLREIEFGAGKTFEVSYLNVPSKANSLIFKLETETPEFDKDNNILSSNFQEV